jgi:hypothetical protein
MHALPLSSYFGYLWASVWEILSGVGVSLGGPGGVFGCFWEPLMPVSELWVGLGSMGGVLGCPFGAKNNLIVSALSLSIYFGYLWASVWGVLGGVGLSLGVLWGVVGCPFGGFINIHVNYYSRAY